MSPIRVALIGLSASAKTSWASEGHLPYLLSSTGRSKYQIVALLNSSEGAAKHAITTYGLPDSTKAYADPQELANDPNIDLVVNNTRVDVHYSTIKPSIEAGKDVYVEWPLADSLATSVELRDLAAQKNVRTIVGLQGRFSPVILKVAELLGSGENGRVGKVLSSEVKGFGSLLGRDWIFEGLEYFGERKKGGNPVTIAFAHMIDYIHSVLGEFSSFQSHAQIQRPKISVLSTSFGSKDSTAFTKTVKSDVPDVLSIHGTLNASSLVAEGAMLSATFRTGPSFPGSPAFVWTIAGTKGEIRVISPAGPYLMSDSYGSIEKPERITIEVHDFAKDAVEIVPWDWNELQKDLSMVRGRLVADVYERFAVNGKDGAWPRFEEAVVRREELEGIFRNFDKQH